MFFRGISRLIGSFRPTESIQRFWNKAARMLVLRHVQRDGPSASEQVVPQSDISSMPGIRFQHVLCLGTTSVFERARLRPCRKRPRINSGFSP